MAILEQPIQILQNQDFSQTFGFAMGDGSGNMANNTAYDFTGSTAKMEVRADADPASTIYMTLTSPADGIVLGSGTSTDGVNTFPVGTIAITITHTQAAAFTAGVYYYDLLVTTIAGLKDYYMSGEFEVRATGTR